MPIYKYTMIKYLKSWSTWVIAAITFLIVFLIVGFVAFSNFDPTKTNAARSYALLAVSLVTGVTSFLSIFTSVFAGFKSATMFKDEVEDGTFLVMLSKPITRSKLILYKWLALLTMLVLYTFLVSLSFLLTIVVFDNGYKVDKLSYGGVNLYTLKSTALQISVIMWAILSVVALIFSSIALLISTHLSVGTTIGIAIALGVVVPMTSLVGIFTKKPPYNSITNANAASLKDVENFLNLPKATNLADDPKTIYSVGISTGDKDSYRHAFVFDINFQIGTLASYASDLAIPKFAKNAVAKASAFSNSANAPGIGNGNFVKAKDQGFFTNVKTSPPRLNTLQQQLLSSVYYTWSHSWSLRNQLLEASALAFFKMMPNSKVKSNFIDTTKVFGSGANELYNPNDYKDITAQLSNSQALWAASVKFLSVEIPKLINTTYDKFDKNQVQHQIALLNLTHALYTAALNNNYNFSVITKIQGTNSSQPSNLSKFASVLKNNGDTDKINQLLYPSGYLGWLSNPLTALSSSSIDTSFTNAKLQMNDDAKYNPPVAKTTSETWANPQQEAVNFLIGNDKVQSDLYRKIGILFDNGFELKRIEYKDYASRTWILATYLIIAFALVPFAYLMIRRQDYR